MNKFDQLYNKIITEMKNSSKKIIKEDLKWHEAIADIDPELHIYLPAYMMDYISDLSQVKQAKGKYYFNVNEPFNGPETYDHAAEQILNLIDEKNIEEVKQFILKDPKMEIAFERKEITNPDDINEVFRAFVSVYGVQSFI